MPEPSPEFVQRLAASGGELVATKLTNDLMVSENEKIYSEHRPNGRDMSTAD
jgi:hypothetical protein